MSASRPPRRSPSPSAGDALFGDTIAWQQEYSANLMAIEYGTGSAASTGVRANRCQSEPINWP